MYVGTLIEDEIDLPRLTEVLDGLGHVGRLATIRGWDGRTQARLWDAAKGHIPLTLEYFVPPAMDPLVEVIHHGKNSLPAFSGFQKRFCRPNQEGAELWGYNANPGYITGPVGPGYYTCHAPEGRDDAAGEIDIDYRKLPPSKPHSWPDIIQNESRLGVFVYAGMVDVMRGISEHISIGRAMKKGRFIDAWFVLCREPTSSAP